MTQEKFAQALGYNRCYVANVEVRKKTFTEELQRKVAILTGAWIGMDEKGEPAPPVFIESWSARGGGDQPEPWFLRERKSYTADHWKRWRGDWTHESDTALRFNGDSEPLSFWLVLLIAAGERAGAAHAVRAQILHALERVRAEYRIGPHLDAILSQYKPLAPEDDLAVREPRKATWRPSSRPPHWLREAIELEPLHLQITPSGIKEGKWVLAMRKFVRNDRKEFLALLSEYPGRAIRWARENRRGGYWLASLAERVAERRFRALLVEGEESAVKWARSNWPDGEWKSILKSWRKDHTKAKSPKRGSSRLKELGKPIRTE